MLEFVHETHPILSAQLPPVDPSINLEIKNGLEAIPFYTSNSH